MSRPIHAFSVEHAELYGIECAILISHFQFWIEQNQNMGRNFNDGRTWMYQTQKEISAVYPYWNRDKVQDLIQKLVDFGVIIKGNYNKTPFDKTAWYAFKNEKMFTKVRNRTIDSSESLNPECQTAQPIPDTKTDAKQKQQQQAVASVVVSSKKTTIKKPTIYECLKDVDIADIPNDQKVLVTSKYSEETVKNALGASTASRHNIKTTFIAYFKMACEKGLKPPKNKEDAFKSNKQIAMNFDGIQNKYAEFRANAKYCEVLYTQSQKQPIVIPYDSDRFMGKLEEAFREANLTHLTHLLSEKPVSGVHSLRECLRKVSNLTLE